MATRSEVWHTWLLVSVDAVQNSDAPSVGVFKSLALLGVT